MSISPCKVAAFVEFKEALQNAPTTKPPGPKLDAFTTYIASLKRPENGLTFTLLLDSISKKCSKPERPKTLASLLKKLDLLESAIRNGDTKKTQAEIILPYLKDENALAAIRKHAKPDVSLDFLVAYDKSLSALDSFLVRVTRGQYGEKVKAKLLDPAETPLYNCQCFLQLLLKDLILTGKNPKEETELFPTLTDEETQELRSKNLTLLQEDALVTQIGSAAYQTDLPFAKFSAFLALFLAPSEDELVQLVLYTARQNAEAGVRLAVELSNETQFVGIDRLFQTANTRDAFRRLLEEIKTKNQELYAYCYCLILQCNPSLQTMSAQELLEKLTPIKEPNYRENVLIKALTREILSDESDKLILSPVSDYHKIRLLIVLIEHLMAEPQNLEDVNNHMPVVLDQLEKFEGSPQVYQAGLARLAGFYVQANNRPDIPEPFFILLKEISDKKTRKLLIEAIGAVLIDKFSAEVVGTLCSAICAKLTSESEKNKFLKTTLLLLAESKIKEAEKLAEKISDPFMRDHALALLRHMSIVQKQKDERLEQRMAHTVGALFGMLSMFGFPIHLLMRPR